MLGFGIPSAESGALTVLCLGAHADDIEIGCGGALLWLKSVFGRNLKVTWVVFSGSVIRLAEANAAAKLFTQGCEAEILLKQYRDGFFPYCGGEIKDDFEELHRRVEPDVIFTHWGDDAHQDHRLISELTWNTFRDHCILQYEIPKYDGDLGRPNLFVPLSKELSETKSNYIFEAFASQRTKRWFDRSTFMGLMRIRGVECGSASGYAEAFHARKIVLAPMGSQ